MPAVLTLHADAGERFVAGETVCFHVQQKVSLSELERELDPLSRRQSLHFPIDFLACPLRNFASHRIRVYDRYNPRMRIRLAVALLFVATAAFANFRDFSD